MAVGLLLSASSCLTVADDEGPILSIELYWDEEVADRDEFVGGTCDSADVDEMRWELINQDDEVIAEDRQPCHNAIDVIDPKPGEYKLVITGFDEDGDERWGVTCTRMSVLRFDVSYDCDIKAP
jgi:hypothetical protein